MKRLFTVMGILLMLFIPNPSFAQIGVIETDRFDLVTANAITSTVSVITGENGGYGSCSGVVIKNTPTKSIVLTAKHCVSFDGEMYVEALRVDDLNVSLKNDIAYLIVNNFIPNKTPARLSDYIPNTGDKIVGVGYPNFNLYISKGKILVESPIEQLAFLKIIKGCSGGGVFNEYGDLIGIMVRYYPGANIGILVRLEDIHKLINKNKLLE